jgi:hypothetical protein
MFNAQEQEIIRAGVKLGKSQEDITNALTRYRLGLGPTEQHEAPKRSTAQDIAVGAAKELGSSVKGIQDSLAASIPSLLAGPIASAIPAVKGKIDSLVQPLKELFQQKLGLTDKNLKADNNAQRVGKGIGLVAEFATPLAAQRVASLTSKAADAALLSGTNLREGLQSLIPKAKLFAAKNNATPQFEKSAERLFLDGTKRIEDPVTQYDRFLDTSKKAITDIHAEPAIAEVGSKIGDEFKFVADMRRHAGTVMGAELKKVGNLKTNIGDAFTTLETALKDADLRYSGPSKKLIPGSASKMTTEDKTLLETYIKEFNKLGSEPTVAQIDGFLSRTQGLVDNFKSAKGITSVTNGERLIKQSQAALRAQLDPAKTGNTKLANYAKARAMYSQLSDFIEDGASYLGKLTQSGDFSKDASLAKSAVQSILNNGKKDWLIKLEALTGYPALDESVLALQAMQDAGDFRGNSLLQLLSQGAIPTSKAGITQKLIDFALEHGVRAVTGSPEEQTRTFLNALRNSSK